VTGFVKVDVVTEPEDEEAKCYEKAGYDYEECVFDTAYV
jgi:hypothetical protein